jgi:hypothetical protein
MIQFSSVYILNKKFKGFVFLLISGFLVWSCIKHVDLPEPRADLTLEQEYATILADLNRAQKIIDSAFQNNTATGVTYNPGDSIKYAKYIIDVTSFKFPDTSYSGIIEVYHSGIYKKNTLKDSVVFKGFSTTGKAGRKLNGNRIILSDNPDSTTVKSRELKFFDTDTITFPSGKLYKLKTSPIYWSDDSSSTQTTTIYGNSIGTVNDPRGIANDQSFSVSIAALAANMTATHFTSFPLIYNWNKCPDFRHPNSGAFTFTNNSQNIYRTINFDKWLNGDNWIHSECHRDTATFISPHGDVYYFSIK